jgi:intein/homing endonuclease
MLRSYLPFYCTEILRGPPEYGGSFLLGPHHIEWGDAVNSEDRILALAARDHGKSMYFCFAYPLWMSDRRKPGRLGYIFSASASQAEEHLEKIRQEIIGGGENGGPNPKLQHLLDHRGGRSRFLKDSARTLKFANGSELRARGFGTRVRGGHPWWGVADDVGNDEWIWSQAVRDKDNDYFLSAIRPMIVPGGQLIVVGCVSPDSWVLTRQGLRQIGELMPDGLQPQQAGDLNIDVHGRFGWRSTSHFWNNGTCKTKRITLERGYSLEGSHRHPVLVMDEDGMPRWRRADELRQGDWVAIKSGAGFGESRASLSSEMAYFLGLWTAEGSVEHCGRLTIANTEPEIREWLRRGNPIGKPFVASGHRMRCQDIRLYREMERLGVGWAIAPQKTVPKAIMAGTRVDVINFLRGLFDGDGNAYSRGKKTQQVMFGTVSESLAREVHLLLLHLGIVSTLTLRPPTKPTKRAPNANYRLWTVRCCGADARKFMRDVGFSIARKQRACPKARASEEPDHGVPCQGALIALMRGEKPRRKRQEKLNPAPLNITEVAKSRKSSRDRLRAALNWFVEYGARGPATCALIANLNERDLVWLRVETIEDREAATVDFVIPVDHSFVSNGIVSHNTPFHALDLYKVLEDTGIYAVLRNPAIKNGKALWPERYNLARLERTKQELGSSLRFSREYLCVDRDTDIRTLGGYKPIVDIRLGDFVLTHRGRFRRVLNVWTNRRGSRGMVRVVASNGEGHLVTHDHEMLVVRATDYQRRQRDFSRESWEEAGTIADKNRWDAVYLKTPVPVLFDRVQVSSDRAFLAGWYVAEGHCSRQNQAVYFSLGVNDPADEIDAACQRAFGAGLKLYPSADFGSARQFVLHSKIAKEWFSRFGNGSENKTFSPLMNANREAKLTALRAYFAGDGHCTPLMWRASSVSRKLICDASDMLLSLGIACSINKPTLGGPRKILGRGVETKTSYRLSVCGSNLTLFAGDGLDRRQSRDFVVDGYLYSRIRKVETVDYTDTEVFDLHVEDDHSYAGLHGTFHNCQPISDEASLFPAYLFDAPGIKQPYALGLPVSYWQTLGYETYAGVDLAMSTSAGADYLVIFVMAVGPDGDRYVVDIVRRKGLGFQAQIDIITMVAKKYECNLVFCEANQYQRVVSDEVVRTSDVPIKAFYTTGRRKTSSSHLGMSQTYSANKSALDQGVPNLRMLLENAKLKIPWASETRPTVQTWIGEMQAFGWADGKLQGVGSHDDTVMAMWICDHACRVGGSSRSFLGEEPQEAGDMGTFAFDTGDPGDTVDELDFFGESRTTGLPGLGFPIPVPPGSY